MRIFVYGILKGYAWRVHGTSMVQSEYVRRSQTYCREGGTCLGTRVAVKIRERTDGGVALHRKDG